MDDSGRTGKGALKKHQNSKKLKVSKLSFVSFAQFFAGLCVKNI